MKKVVLQLISVLVFCNFSAQASESVLTGPRRVGEVMWLENEAVEFVLSQVKPYLGDLYEPLIQNANKVRLVKSETGLDVTAYFNDRLHLIFKDVYVTKLLGVYGFNIPKEFHFSLSLVDGVLKIFNFQLGSFKERFSVISRIPFLPDNVYPHFIEANLTTGKIKATLGFLWDLIPIEVSTNIKNPKNFMFRSTWDSLMLESKALIN